MIGDRHHQARLQSQVYFKAYYRFLNLLLFIFGLMVIFLCVIAFLVVFRAPPAYYATTTTGEIIPMVASA